MISKELLEYVSDHINSKIYYNIMHGWKQDKFTSLHAAVEPLTSQKPLPLPLRPKKHTNTPKNTKQKQKGRQRQKDD